MNLIHFDGKLYYALKPVNSLFNSTLIREVYTRGDFMACDLLTGDMTVLPGSARLARKRINTSQRQAIEREFRSYVANVGGKLLRRCGDLTVISDADKSLADNLEEEQAKLTAAEDSIQTLRDRLNGRISATAIAFEGIDEMQGRSLARGGFTAVTSIARSRGVLNEAAALVGIKTADEREDGLQLLRKLEEVYLPKEESVVASASVSEAEGTSVIEEAAPVAKPRAKRVRKNAASKE